jgi:protease I
MVVKKTKVVAIFTEREYEDLELWYPYHRLKEAGYKPLLVGPEAGKTYKSKHGYEAKSDKGIDDVALQDIDGIVIPGGYSPDFMRRNPKMVQLVSDAILKNKTVAAICHGPWMLCSAKVLKGRRATSYKSIKDDLENAGAHWIDEEVVVDGPIITSRTPDDLPVFMKATLENLEK